MLGLRTEVNLTGAYSRSAVILPFTVFDCKVLAIHRSKSREPKAKFVSKKVCFGIGVENISNEVGSVKNVSS